MSKERRCLPKWVLIWEVLSIPCKRCDDTYLPISGGSRPNDTSFSARCVKFRNCVNPSGNLQVKQSNILNWGKASQGEHAKHSQYRGDVNWILVQFVSRPLCQDLSKEWQRLKLGRLGRSCAICVKRTVAIFVWTRLEGRMEICGDALTCMSNAVPFKLVKDIELYSSAQHINIIRLFQRIKFILVLQEV